MLLHLTVYGSQMEAWIVGKVSVIGVLDGTGLYENNGKLPLSPAEMFMLLPISELTYRGSLKKISEDRMLSYGTFSVWKSIFAIFDLVRGSKWFCRSIITEDMNEHSIFYPAVQLFLSSACTRGTSRLEAETPPCSPVPVLAPWSDRSPAPCAGDEQLLT